MREKEPTLEAPMEPVRGLDAEAPHRSPEPIASELEHLHRRVAELEAGRGQRAPFIAAKARALSLVIVGIVLGAVVSARASTLVNGLWVFAAGEAARASEINHNFATLAQVDAASTQRADALAARIATLETSLHRLPVSLAQGARFDVPKNGTTAGIATCPAGTRPISGFIKVTHPFCAAVNEGYIDGNSWRASVRQAFCLDSQSGGIGVDIWAVCIPAP